MLVTHQAQTVLRGARRSPCRPPFPFDAQIPYEHLI